MQLETKSPFKKVHSFQVPHGATENQIIEKLADQLSESSASMTAS